MNLKLISNDQLEVRLKTLTSQERELLHDILLTIKEIDTRKYFLDLGFSNLFEYLTQFIGYSAGAAQRRIDAARLLKDVPALAEKIQNGEIHLNQVAILQKAIRQTKKDGKIVTKEQKAELLEMAAGKNHRETEQLVAQSLDLEVLKSIKQTYQADESVRLELTLTKEQYEKLQKAKDLLSHSVPTGNLVSLIEYLSDRVIQQKTMTRTKRIKSESFAQSPVGDESTAPKEQKQTSSKGQKLTATMEVKSIAAERKGYKTVKAFESKVGVQKSLRSVPQNIKKELLTEQKCCQYVDARTNRKCGSHWQLQVDHRRPVWAGGTNDKSNLRLLCGAHNRWVYQKQAGIRIA